MSGPFKNRTNGCHFVWFLNGRDHLKTKFLKLSLWNGFGIQMVGIRVFTVYWLYETINTLLRSTFVCHRRCLSHWRVRSVTSHLSCHTRLSGCVKRYDPYIFANLSVVKSRLRSCFMRNICRQTSWQRGQISKKN